MSPPDRRSVPVRLRHRPVKGFAVTLSIGIVVSMFTAIFVTRIIFDYFVWNRNIQKISI